MQACRYEVDVHNPDLTEDYSNMKLDGFMRELPAVHFVLAFKTSIPCKATLCLPFPTPYPLYGLYLPPGDIQGNQETASFAKR